MLWASTTLAKDKDSPNTFFHLRAHLAPSGYSTSSKANKSGEIKTMANIHVARMRKGHSLDLMSGERSANTTAPNRSTAIRIRFWIETTKETLPNKEDVNWVNRLATKGEKYYWLPTKRVKNNWLPTGKILTDYRHGLTLSIFVSEKRAFCIIF